MLKEDEHCAFAPWPRQRGTKSRRGNTRGKGRLGLRHGLANGSSSARTRNRPGQRELVESRLFEIASILCPIWVGQSNEWELVKLPDTPPPPCPSRMFSPPGRRDRARLARTPNGQRSRTSLAPNGERRAEESGNRARPRPEWRGMQRIRATVRRWAPAPMASVVQLSSNPRGREASRISRGSTRRETRGARLPNGWTCEKGVAHSPVTRSRPEVLGRERPVTG